MFYHKPVLLEECTRIIRDELGTDNDKTLVDCNLGEGGHASAFLSTFGNLRIVGIDRDSQILETARERLEGFGDRVSIINDWSDSYLEGAQEGSVDCVFFDFGISMFHYKGSGRGFSFLEDEKLDMRLDENQIISAYDIVNYRREKELADLIYANSGEKKSRKIARAIAEKRRFAKIETTLQLKEIVDSCFSPLERRKSDTQVATRTFQAIRIEVNNELGRMKRAIKYAFRALKCGGVMMAITFHSLEDSIVKWSYREFASQANARLLTRKPIAPQESEVAENSASRSAKLRVIRREI